MLGRICFTLLLLLCSSSFSVSAQSDLTNEDAPSDIKEKGLQFNTPTGHLKVEFEVARAAFIPRQPSVSHGRVSLHCSGLRAIGDKIFWAKNGVRLTDANKIDNKWEATVQSTYKLTSDKEAYYSCNGVGMYLLEEQTAVGKKEASVWQGSPVVCIDKIPSEETVELERMDGAYKTRIFLWHDKQVAIYPVKERKVASDMTVQCNMTDEYTFIAEKRPVTTVEFKGKKVICTNTDTQGRCLLKIFFSDKEVASGLSPVLEHPYGAINIQKVSCTADCEIGEDFITLAVQAIEINRTLYICVILVIIFIIIIIIVVVFCVLWHKFGFKEKYGYQINMRLRKNFAVDGNKLSSYRLSGVEADAAADDDSEPDVIKEFRDMDDGSLVEDDSFVDPNFARTNQKVDMRSKDDISGHHPSQRPFLRI